ncbi:PREDICTED: uncharacterized protein LOC109349517 [Lupinus angustifolius]|uniref:uncharacterized protein LOC109349517 n=1 Tax=Lupinus angustifolius TaxID=3871 RepID=UPI00092F7F63|nr:PREDICTED: uncharacterized protein LOC109349517 [Lupinus angustifolius]
MRVPSLTKDSALEKYHIAILEFNYLIKTTLQVIELIFDLGKLTSTHKTNEVPALILALEQIPVYVYWAVGCHHVAAIVTQIDSLTIEKDTRCIMSAFLTLKT